jgi:hypothetical protein
MVKRFGLRSLFYLTFLFGSTSLAARMIMDTPNFAVPIVFIVAWLTAIALVLVSITFRR